MKVIRHDGIDTYIVACLMKLVMGETLLLKQEVIYWHDVQMYSFYQE